MIIYTTDPEEEARLDKQRFKLDFQNMDKKSFGGWSRVEILFLGIIAVFHCATSSDVLNVIDYTKSA